MPWQANEVLIKECKTPKLRPVTQSPTILNDIGANTLQSEHGAAVIKTISSINKGFGKNGGIETAIHTARAAYNAENALLTFDAKHFFGSLDRESLLQASKELWPQGYPYLQRYAGFPSMSFMFSTDQNGRPCIKIIYCHEGAKQGEATSSCTSSIAAHHYIYQPLAEALPILSTPEENYAVKLIAIIDDLLAMIKTPSRTASQAQWDLWYHGVRGLYQAYDLLANKHGVYRNLSKCKLLVPWYAKMPSQPMGFVVIRTGIVFGGSPIGTADFMRDFVADKVASLIELKGSKISQVLSKHTQLGMKLLHQGFNRGLDHVMRTTPSTSVREALLLFDSFVTDTVLSNICDPATLQSVSVERLARAIMIMRLPTKFGGFNLVALIDRADACYIASILGSATDPLFQKFASFLLTEVTTAHANYCSLAGFAPSELVESHPLSIILPANPAKLVSKSFASRISKSLSTKNGIMALLNNFIQTKRQLELKESVFKESPSNQDKSDFIHIHTITGRSQLNRVFSADLSSPLNRIDSRYCQAAIAFFLALPLKFSGALTIEGFDYNVSQCLTCSDKGPPAFFDVSGDHSAACKHTHAPRSSTHSDVLRAICAFSKAAGFETTREPPTENILSSLSANRNLVRSLLPTKNTTLAKATQTNLIERLEIIQSTADPTHRQRLATEALQSLPSHGENNNTLRADVLISDPLCRNKSRLVDFTAPHSSCKSVRNSQYGFLRKQFLAEKDLLLVGMTPGSSSESKACAAASRKKHKKYHFIETLANIQAASFGNSSPLVFVAAVLTHRGEFSSDFLDLIEFCAARFKALRKASPDICGLSHSQATARFRGTFKTAIYCALVNGFGR